MPIIHCKELEKLIKSSYTLKDINEIEKLLYSRGTFEFPYLKNGLFSASLLGSPVSHTGYENVWVRDNFHVSYCHYITGQTEIASKNSTALMLFFKKHKQRFKDIIEHRVSPDNPMNRPHIRFNGQTMEEIDEKWSHAQNDALGYLLWFYSKLAMELLIKPSTEDWEILALFALYFDAIKYWQDEDSGHWEEIRKINASSIGIVVAALKNLKALIVSQPEASSHCRCMDKAITGELIESLIQRGNKALGEILPSECAQDDPKKNRPVDSALLFLIYPMNILDDKMRDAVLNNITTRLQGDYGIRRYLGPLAG